MSNVIDFLARMGAEADLRDAGTEALARELAEANVDGELAAAILAADGDTLRERVAPGTYYSIQLDREKEDPEQDEKEEAPDNDGAEKSALAHSA
ncbi:hypothetical protein [Luteibacter sp. UNCMF366Tsu5.1]|uniref:hypothetical protein n=1 Tax=Luteibacter sp. UNCMF366Tsu5.1 TaxID=1502758 RepID=UPI000908AE31|nr:hypothetical protein [Luteibacter sp. UNCMF366Tsu5.1]SFW75348.1 hypothetical protein SAMN02800691_3540 [Luteibacter sp. UNCMF366Tsu5.1]